MRPVVFMLLALSLITHATFLNHHEHRAGHLHASHRGQLAKRLNSSLTTRTVEKRCKVRATPARVKPTPSASKPSSSETSSASKAKPTKSTNSAVSSSASGLLKVSSDCGPSGATKAITATSGPNGDIDFFNCGIQGSGWNPPHVRVDQLIAPDFDAALADDSTPFKQCRPYLSLFKKYANEHGFSPMILASFAMQESSCNPDTVGGGGEQGLMQITQDKCGGAPDGNCKDPDFNIKTAAKYFADSLAGNDGNVIITVGEYNGWKRGMTYADATAARHTSCCRCQNNLDYLVQFFNGWMQNKNAYQLNIGTFFNLNVCH